MIQIQFIYKKDHSFPSFQSQTEEASNFDEIMEKTTKIMRRSIFTFLQNVHYFTSTSVFLSLPFSASILLSHTLFPPFHLLIQDHFFTPFFQSIGLPSSSNSIFFLNFNLPQTILTSVLNLPFSLSFLLLAKASIIQALKPHQPSLPPQFSSFKFLYKPLILTHLCNSVLILTTYAAAFFSLFLIIKTIEAIGFAYDNPLFPPASRAFLYSFTANNIVNCNLALVVAGMDNFIGFRAIFKAILLRKGRNSMALLLALPSNIALPAIEALFRFRVLREYDILGRPRPSTSMALEGIFIAYLYSLVLVLDTVATCVYFKTFASTYRIERANESSYMIDFVEEDDADSKFSREIP